MKYKYLITTLFVVLSCSWLEVYAGFGGSSGGGSRSVSVSRSPSTSYSRPAPSTSTIAKTTAGAALVTASTQQKAMSLYDSKTTTTSMTKPAVSTVQPVQGTRYTPASTYTPSVTSVANNRTTVINNTTVVHQNSGSGSGLGTGLVVGAVAGALIADSGRHDTVYVQQSAPPVQYVQPTEPVQNNYTPAPVSSKTAADVHSGFSWSILLLVIIAMVILAFVVSTAYSNSSKR